VNKSASVARRASMVEFRCAMIPPSDRSARSSAPRHDTRVNKARWPVYRADRRACSVGRKATVTLRTRLQDEPAGRLGSRGVPLVYLSRLPQDACSNSDYQLPIEEPPATGALLDYRPICSVKRCWTCGCELVRD